MSDTDEQDLHQHTAGIPVAPRGQRMGRGNDYDPNRHEMEDIAEEGATPAISGDRPAESEFYADPSSQHIGGDAVTPDHVSPSVPAAIPSGTSFGKSGGEAEFKQRQEKK